MTNQSTIDKLIEMRLTAMADAFRNQLPNTYSRRAIMPRNQFQRTIFALLTVVVTVHAYVFFSLYVLHGDLFMQLTGETCFQIPFQKRYCKQKRRMGINYI